MDKLLRKVYIFLIITGLMLSYASFHKRMNQNRQMAKKEVVEWKKRNEKERQLHEEACIRHIIDSIQSKDNVTQQDINYVREHSQYDIDESWCRFRELELQYDSLQLMRLKIGKRDGYQAIAQLFDKEFVEFEKYRESARNAYVLAEDIEEIGSRTARALCASGFAWTCFCQYHISVAGTLQYLCGERSQMIRHKIITKRMIDNAYSNLIDIQEDSRSYRDSSRQDGFSKKQKQEALRNEQSAWNRWMDFRKKVSEDLPDSIRAYYDNETNNVKRNKLIMLKNQYRDIGIIGNDVIKCLLPYDCTDDELSEYVSFSYIWNVYSKHLDDDKWVDWKRYRHLSVL